MLCVKKLTIAPWNEPLLQDIDLDVACGEIHGLIGPNGAGKTSLLNTIAGDLDIQSGQILVDSKALPDWPRRQLACRMAVLPQQSQLNFPFRVEQVVAMGRTPHDSGAQLDRAITHEAMHALDIGALAGKLYTQLSGGEKQRVQLARILAQVWETDRTSPSLLLLDEPTAALDLAHQQQVIELLRNLAGKGLAILLVVHDFNLLASVADRISVLSGGRLQTRGSPAEVLTEKLFAEEFGVKVSVIPHPRNQLPMVMPL